MHINLSKDHASTSCASDSLNTDRRKSLAKKSQYSTLHNVPIYVLQHCVEGLMVFSPVLFRLERGYHPENPVGSWEGHGIFAVYKSDWVRFGGMDLNETTTQREMLSHFAMAGLEVARTKLNNFYHLYHTH